MNPDLLLARVKSGDRLTPAELASVRAALAGNDSAYDPYTLVHLLWKSEDRSCEDLLLDTLRRFSSDGGGPDDGTDMVRRIIVQALAHLFPSPKTFALVTNLMQCDPSTFVRQVAASAAGDLGGTIPAVRRAAAQLLLERFRSCAGASRSDWEDAYFGLLNLLDVPYSDRPLPTRALRETDIDPAVLRAAAEIE